ncbi:glycogen debranching N-terminal domain-containing protein [Streptomyces sp. NPDC004262]
MRSGHTCSVSNRHDPVTARVQINVDADFADLFELRADDRRYDEPEADRQVRRADDALRFDYRRPG